MSLTLGALFLVSSANATNASMTVKDESVTVTRHAGEGISRRSIMFFVVSLYRWEKS